MNLKHLKAMLAEKKLDCALFIAEEQPDPAITSLTTIPDLTHAALIVPKKGKPTLYVSALSYNEVKKLSHIQIKPLIGSISKIIKPALHGKKYGIDAKRISHYNYTVLCTKLKNCSFVDISEQISLILSVKEDWEIRRITKACEIADGAFSKIVENFHFSTESEVRAAIEYEITSSGAAVAFPTIVASGPNAAVPHHITSNAKLKRGFCIIDFGASYKGYNSDCTRIIFIGKPSKYETSLYKKVLSSQTAAIKNINPGKTWASIDKLSRKTLGNLSKHFIHSLGHGIGTEVHEEPGISPKSRSRIAKNNTFTIEPGIYIPGKLGIRIEDTLVVSSKAEILTKIPKELVCINLKQ